MSDYQKCSRVCLIASAVVGLVVTILGYFNADFNMLVSLILGLLAFGVGYWIFKMIFCGETSEGAISRPASAPAAASTPTAATPAPAASPEAATSPDSQPETTTGSSDSSWTDSVSASSGKAGDTRGATGLKPSVVLADEATLRDGVGSWKYGVDAPAAAVTETASAPTKGSAAKDGDFDGDGVVEGTAEGEKPATLKKARGGKADDLKQIKGVGPKMEGLLNSLGFFHFDQMASWSYQEVAWVDANLEGFRGRVSRDNWVDQAKVLASGGETEFSKRVEDGGVY